MGCIASKSNPTKNSKNLTSPPSMEDEQRQRKQQQRGSDGLTAFTLRLAKQLAAENDAARRNNNNNIVFSPLSIYAVLGLVAAGARGAALDELLALLGASSRDDLAVFVRDVAERAFLSGGSGPVVSFASGVWRDRTVSLDPSFLAAAAETYKAEVRAVDFKENRDEAIDEINRWVSKATRGLIDGVLDGDSVGPLTRLVLVNAVYFKGKWAIPFDPSRTDMAGKFHLLGGGGAVDAPMMRGSGRRLVAVHPGFKVLKLRYQAPFGLDGAGGESSAAAAWYSMCVFLPDERDGLWGLVDEIASRPSFLRDHLWVNMVKVGDLRLPRFKMTFSRELAGALRAIGLKATLDPAQERGDLSGIAAEESGAAGTLPPLSIDGICHKAVIEVNEEGTEAAAVTCARAGREASLPAPPVDFVADHPFAFFLMEEVSGAVVFAGCVLDPTK
ncbi:unnamed protein product [Urochloa decumbens]|uniref:Serpin domain-containing protein n=1 Tax=Urochloa decumbens TaxID=240449 RepID=A0ABC9DV03_9POAL